MECLLHSAKLPGDIKYIDLLLIDKIILASTMCQAPYVHYSVHMKSCRVYTLVPILQMGKLRTSDHLCNFAVARVTHSLLLGAYCVLHNGLSSVYCLVGLCEVDCITHPFYR